MADKKSERDERLARALRENLRRRKVTARSNDDAVVPDLIRDPPSSAPKQAGPGSRPW